MDTDRCPRNHEAMKRDERLWLSLKFVGLQKFLDDMPIIEQRNCPACNSTLGREVVAEVQS